MHKPSGLKTTTEPFTDQPLASTIPPSTHEVLALHGLLRRALPVIQSPEQYSLAVRRGLVRAISVALCEPASGSETASAVPSHSDAKAPPDYEPGCDLRDWP